MVNDTCMFLSLRNECLSFEKVKIHHFATSTLSRLSLDWPSVSSDYLEWGWYTLHRKLLQCTMYPFYNQTRSYICSSHWSKWRWTKLFTALPSCICLCVCRMNTWIAVLPMLWWSTSPAFGGTGSTSPCKVWGSTLLTSFSIEFQSFRDRCKVDPEDLVCNVLPLQLTGTFYYQLHTNTIDLHLAWATKQQKINPKILCETSHTSKPSYFAQKVIFPVLSKSMGGGGKKYVLHHKYWLDPLSSPIKM